jgi:hypothetical protein
VAAQSNRLTAVSLLGAHLLVNCACFTTLSAFTAARQSWLLFPPAPVHPAAGIWITFAGADCRSTPIGRISNYFLRYLTSPDERRNPPPFPIAVPFLHVRTSPTHGRAPSPCKTRWVAKRLGAPATPLRDCYNALPRCPAQPPKRTFDVRKNIFTISTSHRSSDLIAAMTCHKKPNSIDISRNSTT